MKKYGKIMLAILLSNAASSAAAVAYSGALFGGKEIFILDLEANQTYYIVVHAQMLNPSLNPGVVFTIGPVESSGAISVAGATYTINVGGFFWAPKYYILPAFPAAGIKTVKVQNAGWFGGKVKIYGNGSWIDCKPIDSTGAGEVGFYAYSGSGNVYVACVYP